MLNRVVRAGLLAALVVGCSDGGPRQYKVAGTVTWQGKPVGAGVINFVDPAGRSAPTSAKIVDGRFEARTTAGPKSVQVYNQRDLGFNKEMNQHVFTNDVPTEYNARSTLAFEVKPTDDNVYDAALPLKK
jgi:hypothetical protein